LYLTWNVGRETCPSAVYCKILFPLMSLDLSYSWKQQTQIWAKKADVKFKRLGRYHVVRTFYRLSLVLKMSKFFSDGLSQ